MRFLRDGKEDIGRLLSDMTKSNCLHAQQCVRIRCYCLGGLGQGAVLDRISMGNYLHVRT
jgi:hypothetical protein